MISAHQDQTVSAELNRLFPMVRALLTEYSGFDPEEWEDRIVAQVDNLLARSWMCPEYPHPGVILYHDHQRRLYWVKFRPKDMH